MPHRDRVALTIAPVVVVAVVVAVAVALSTSPEQSAPAAAPSFTTVAEPAEVDLVVAREAAGIAGCPESDPRVAPRSDGLPDISLPCLDRSREVRLAGLRGKPMIVNIWATWCGPCRQEAPHLAAYADLSREQVQFLGIDVADPDPAGAIRFAEFSQWDWPQLADASGRIRESYGPMIPQTLFVTADGVVVHRKVGPVGSIDELQDLSARYLGVD